MLQVLAMILIGVLGERYGTLSGYSGGRDGLY